MDETWDHRRTSLTRLKKLQLSLDPGNSILIIAGADGAVSSTSVRVIEWLLLGRSHKELSSDAGAYYGNTPAHDALEELFLIVTHDACAIFFQPDASPILDAVLSFWASAAVGFRFASEKSEDAKVFYFRKWVHELLPPSSTVFLPYPIALVSPGELEQASELIESFAAEEASGSLGSLGFFTKRHRVQDLREDA